MRPKELLKLGVPHGPVLAVAVESVKQASAMGVKKGALRQTIRRILADPSTSRQDPVFGPLAEALIERKQAQGQFLHRPEPAPYRQWGTDLEPGAIKQMKNACSLPVALRGALMPDAHQGYGLPIGGVLAVEQAVIPYAVGMDIGCRMKLSVLDWPVAALERKRKDLEKALTQETRFGVGSTFRHRRQHPVMDRDWSVSPITREGKDQAWSQLGTSGSGNHFVEFGILFLDDQELGLERGRYLALLSHSGARGVGAQVATHYSQLAMKQHPELPKELKHLSWLALSSDAGQEYWQAMELMGSYSAANHELIHRHLTVSLGAEVIADVENHHNYAWREQHFGHEVIVHRKGATPAGDGVLGIIPGSMATPGYVVRGRGHLESLNSAAHGAGRKMSRKAAKARYTWADARRFLEKRGVKVLSAGVDEVPMAYKDIETVMEAQRDLVQRVARFEPKLVKMAP
jgi:tRNA-splicing ligase RtcB